MKGKRFTEEQIAFALRQAEGGAPVKEICRKMKVGAQTFYRWKKKSDGMRVAEVRRFKLRGLNSPWHPRDRAAHETAGCGPGVCIPHPDNWIHRKPRVQA